MSLRIDKIGTLAAWRFEIHPIWSFWDASELEPFGIGEIAPFQIGKIGTLTGWPFGRFYSLAKSGSFRVDPSVILPDLRFWDPSGLWPFLIGEIGTSNLMISGPLQTGVSSTLLNWQNLDPSRFLVSILFRTGAIETLIKWFFIHFGNVALLDWRKWDPSGLVKQSLPTFLNSRRYDLTFLWDSLGLFPIGEIGTLLGWRFRDSTELAFFRHFRIRTLIDWRHRDPFGYAFWNPWEFAFLRPFQIGNFPDRRNRDTSGLVKHWRIS